MKIFVAMVFLCMTFLPSCSSDQDKKEKGAIEKQQEKVAQEAVQAIKIPLDQANKAAEQEASHIRQMEEEMKKQ